MKTNIKILFILLICTLMYNCTDDSTFTYDETEKLELRNSSSQDVDYRNLAKVVSKAVNDNSEFRCLLKAKALEQFDGDYDILVSQIKDKVIQTQSGSISVKIFLGSIYRSLEISQYREGRPYSTIGITSDGITSTNDIIEYICSIYPLVQISIPKNIDNWDCDSYIPPCVFIPTDYNEGTTKTFEGYNNNNPISVDAVNAPTNPVIVVSDNERSRSSKVLKIADVDIVLSGNTSATGISLTWEIDNPNDDDITGYRIYRKTLTSNNFELLFENNGEENKVYNDNSVSSLENYFYYVKAYNAVGESESSNIVQVIAPSVPLAPSDFSANHFITDEIELRWTHENGQFIENSTLFKRVVGINSQYLEVGTFDPSINEHIDNNVIDGRKVLYKIEDNNNQGNSNPKYDFIEVPFRDVSTPSPTRVTRIRYDEAREGEIEGWGRGRPEIQLTVVKAAQSGDAGIVQEEMFFDLGSDNDQFNELILNWDPGDWAEVITIQAIEIDKGPNIDLSLSAGFDKKDTITSTFIKGSIDITINDITNTKNETVGRREYRYRDPLNATLEFPRGGVLIDISSN